SDRAPNQYVEKLFDDYAEKFESHLVQVLGYTIPQKLVDLVEQCANPQVGQWNILDLGCGTGLAGSGFARYARQLVGVDLSANMLARAKALNVYHRLEQSDLLQMMQAETPSIYDLV